MTHFKQKIIPILATIPIVLVGLISPMRSFGETVAPSSSATVYPTFKTASPASQFVQKITGFTLVSGWMANSLLHYELSRHFHGKLHSKLTLFSGSDLLSGKLKQVKLTGDRVVLDGFIPISSYRFENQADMPIVFTQSKHPMLSRPVQFKAVVVMTQKDVNQMLQSKKAKSLLSGMAISIPPFGKQSVDVLQPNVKFQGNRLVIHSLVNGHGAPAKGAVPITVSGLLSAKDAHLDFSDVKLGIAGIQDTKPISQLIQNYFGELVNFDHVKLDQHRVKISVEKSQVENNQLYVETAIWVEPDPKALQIELNPPAHLKTKASLASPPAQK